MICDKSPAIATGNCSNRSHKQKGPANSPRILPWWPVRGDPHGLPCLTPTSGRRLRCGRGRSPSAAGQCQAHARPHLARRPRPRRRRLDWLCCCCAAAGVHWRAVHAPPQVARGGRRPWQKAGEVAQGDARLAHGPRRARRLRHLPGGAQPARRLLAAGRPPGQRRRHARAPVQVPQAVHGVPLLQLDGVRDVGGHHRPAHERVILPLGGQGGGAGDHRGARHGGAHGRLHRRMHPRGLLLHLHHRPHRRRLPLRRLHGAVPAQALGLRRPRALRPQGGPGRRAARAARHPRRGQAADGYRPNQVCAAAVGWIGRSR